MKRLKTLLLLSDKGYHDLKRAILACTMTNLALLLPVVISVGIFMEILKPLSGEAFDSQKCWLLFAGGLLAAVIVFLCAKNDYQKTYIVSYEEAGHTRIRVAEHLRKLPMSFFNTRDLSELTTHMMADCRSMESMLSSTIPPLIADLVSVCVTCIAMAFFDLRMALAIFCTLPLSMLVIVYSRKRQRKLFETQVSANLKASDQIQEYLEGIKVIKVNNLAGEQFQTLDKALLAMKQIALKVEMIVGVLIGSANMILQSGLGISIFVGITLLTHEQISFIDLLMFLIVSTRIYGPILAVMGQLSTLLHLETVTKRMRTLLTTPEMTGEEATIESMNIELNHVDFGYQKERVLHDVSLHIPENSVTAIVGPSGSGKSTLTKLIARFWDVDQGQICIGGKDIKTIKPECLMRQMSFVFQEVILFNDTILNNIRIGKATASKEEVIEAAKAAQIHEWILSLPKGYDTMLGENGATLSGGERQRISIARAILKDAPIILLDEATASLDPENEVLVQQAINRLTQHKTVIMIAHHLRTVSQADQIFVLDEGRLTESGTHRELMERHGLYAKLFKLQQEAIEWTA